MDCSNRFKSTQACVGTELGPSADHPRTNVVRLDGTGPRREEGDQVGGNVTTQEGDEHTAGQTSESTVEVGKGNWIQLLF